PAAEKTTHDGGEVEERASVHSTMAGCPKTVTKRSGTQDRRSQRLSSSPSPKSASAAITSSHVHTGTSRAGVSRPEVVTFSSPNQRCRSSRGTRRRSLSSDPRKAEKERAGSACPSPSFTP